MSLAKEQGMALLKSSIPGRSSNPTSTGTNSSNKKPLLNEEAYKVEINANYGNKRISVSAPLPESFDFAINSNYSAPFEEGLMPSGKLQGAMSFAGYTGLVQAMSAQIWNSSSGVELQLPFAFVARENPQTEIRDKILNLLALCTPTSETSFSLLVPPGPSLNFAAARDLIPAFGDLAFATVSSTFGIEEQAELDRRFARIQQVFESAVRNKISLSIGNFLTFNSVIVKGVNIRMESILSSDTFSNFPWRVIADVSFQTFVTPTYRDLQGIFKVAQQTREG